MASASALIVVFIAILAFLAFKYVPSVLEPVLWVSPNPLPKLEGVLASNNLLTVGLRKLTHISANKNEEKNRVQYNHPFSGPESIVFDSMNGDAFVSLNDGTVAVFEASGRYTDRIFFTGRYIEKPSSLNGLQKSGNTLLLNWCNKEAIAGYLAWNALAGKICGRPLGLRFRIENSPEHPEGRKVLYILDAYHGLFLLDLQTLSATHLVKPTSKIHISDTVTNPDPVITLPPLFFDDLDVFHSGADSEDVTVVFSDASYKHPINDYRREVLDGAPRGRLFKFTLSTGRLEVLLCGLHFPNGVQSFGSDNGEVLVAELARFRILKVNTSSLALSTNSFSGSDSCGESGYLHQALTHAEDSNTDNYQQFGVTIFYDSLPGILDNIRSAGINSDGKRSYFLAFGGISAQPFSILWTIYQSKLMREIIGRFVPMKVVERLEAPSGLVVEVDDNGKPLRSWHDPKGVNISRLSHAERNPITGEIWLGSPSNDYIGILKGDAIN